MLRSYKGKYFNKVVGLAKGKQQARSVHDTYFEIIRHISLLGKSVIHVEELRERIVKVTVDQKEQNRRHTSFYNCLKNLPAVIQERQLNDALYFNATSKTISIEDPSFAFYLKLVDFDELKRSIRIRRDDYVYDVAISFAGEQRAHASGLKEELERLGYSVFYDFDEQHILWGQNLRSKLADVYARDAKFMVVMLSKEYPEKDWPAFEFEVGKEAKRGRVAEYLLPLVVDDVHVVGLSSDVGHLDLRRMSVAQVAQILAKKIEESPGPLFERGLAP